jgi:O-antigen ligase
MVLDPRAGLLKRGVAAVVVAGAVYAIFINSVFWVSGWVALFACLATITWLKSRKIFAVALTIACILTVAFWPFIRHNIIITSAEEGDLDRLSLLAGSVKYATVFPLGVGLGNYRSYNSFYYGDKWGTTSYTSAHGTYAQHLSEMGFPGLVLFGAILVCGFRWMHRSYRHVNHGPTKAYMLAAMGQLVGIASAAFIGDYIVPTYHNGGIVTFSAAVYSWLTWGLAVAHVRIHGIEVSENARDRRGREREEFDHPLPLVRM